MANSLRVGFRTKSYVEYRPLSEQEMSARAYPTALKVYDLGVSAAQTLASRFKDRAIILVTCQEDPDMILLGFYTGLLAQGVTVTLMGEESGQVVVAWRLVPIGDIN